jgi:ligand-binding SRPBCC domain-containing protein
VAHFEAVQWLPVELRRVFAFFSCPANLPRIMPPELQVRTEWAELVPPVAGRASVSETLEMEAAGAGSEFVISFRPLPLLPIRMEWHARIEEYEPGKFFRDIQLTGPMRRWSHRHKFQSENRNGVDGTLIQDCVEFELGYGWPGRLLERCFVLPSLRKSFTQRQGLIERALQ